MEFGYDFWLFIVRWLHVLSGVMWIGLLWYFNFVQTPTVPTIPEDLRPAIPKHIMPVALFWFRWAAVSTVVWGLILAWMNGYLAPSLAIGLTDNVAKHAMIGIGMWMGGNIAKTCGTQLMQGIGKHRGMMNRQVEEGSHAGMHRSTQVGRTAGWPHNQTIGSKSHGAANHCADIVRTCQPIHGHQKTRV